jgi:radical SAM protein with 4Fe4S-binding SPASM domain
MEQIAGFCKPILIVSGGDPLLRADIFEITAYASKLGIRVVMSPSGSNITLQVIGKMKEAGVRMISVSLDGSTPQIHDGFRQVNGAYNLSMQNIAVAKAGGLPFRINTTVTKHNVTDIDAMLSVAVTAGAVEWDVFMLVPTGRGKIEMEITPNQYEAILQHIHKLSHTSPIPIKMTCAPMYSRVAHQQQKDKVAGHMGRGCMAGNGFCFISHTGEVFGCGFLPLSAGNVRTQSFRDIYQSAPLFAKLRDPSLLTGKCGACEFKTICGGCRARALAVNRNVLAEEPYCTYTPAALG